jgi:hypothetical protein
MSKYYTTLDVVDDKFIGTVYDANTNTTVYKTTPYLTQLEATQQIDKFLATGVIPPENAATPTSQTVITNTYVAPTPTPPRRCCGR